MLFKNFLIFLTGILVVMPTLGQEGQVAHYQFEGDSQDSGNFGAHLQNAGGVVYEAGRFGQAAYFDGSAQSYLYLEEGLGFDPSLGFTISVWIKPEPGAYRMRIVDSRGTGKSGQYPGFQLRIGNKDGQWGVRGGAIDDASGQWKNCGGCGSDYAYSRWYHLTMVYEQNQELRFYVDGKLDGVKTVGTYGDISNGLPLAIGAAIAKNGGLTHVSKQRFTGHMDELRIFQAALFPSEIQALSNAQWASRREMVVDYLSEASGMSHQMGFFYLDIDTNGDGIPDFKQIGDYDDLDGDLIINMDDEDDDGDGIPDVYDRAGYVELEGPHAGIAPETNESVPAAFFAYGEAAAEAGMHQGDYWQFVPNGIYEQTGAPYTDNHGRSYEHVYLQPGAYLYVDSRSPNDPSPDTIPDVLQKLHGSTRLPAMVLDQDWETENLHGNIVPGLLGSWNGSSVGATIFYLCDDDGGTGVTSRYTDHTPYQQTGVQLYQDIESITNGQPDYLIYGSDDENSGAIPANLLESDGLGQRLWRYRWQGESVSNQREIVYFLTAYWLMGGQEVHVFYSKTDFNPDSLGSNYPITNQTNGDYFGVEDVLDYQGPVVPHNWFPDFQNQPDHDLLAEAVFGIGFSWNDIATASVDGNAPVAHDPNHQAWVDTYNNFDPSRRIMNYRNAYHGLGNLPADIWSLTYDRYGVDLGEIETNLLFRASNYRLQHFTSFSIATESAPDAGWLMSWEDLYYAGDRDFNDLVFRTNRPPSFDP